MTLKTHLNISALLIETIDKAMTAEIKPFWFKLGSIMPDINLYHRVQPHHVRHAKMHIEKYIKRISQKDIGQKRLALYLGITSHFISDTFCLMHNDKTGKNPSIHSRYEGQLSDVFASFSKHLCFMPAGQSSPYDEAKDKDISAYILDENKRYPSATTT